MKNKRLVVTLLSIVSAIAVSAIVVIPIVAINANKRNNPVSPTGEITTVTFDSASLKGIGIEPDGLVHIELDSEKTSPSGKPFKSVMTTVDDYSYSTSYIEADDILNSSGGHILVLGTNNATSTINTHLYLEFEFANDAEYLSIDINGEFYFDETLATKETKITYGKDQISALTVIDIKNEYYKMVIDTIVFSYKALA